MASLMTIKLNKNAGSTWGFRLQGGKDFATPLCIQKVNGGSVAEKAGLQAGDAIVSINNHDALSLRHKEAQDTIVSAGNNFDIVIQRGSQIWKPHVTPLPEAITLQGGDIVATKTSLAANQKPSRYIGSNHNCVPRPFPGAFSNGVSSSISSSSAFSHPSNTIKPTDTCVALQEEKDSYKNGFHRTEAESSRVKSPGKERLVPNPQNGYPHFNIDEATAELTISGTDITLDKEKAKNFLIMTLDRENGNTHFHRSSSKSPIQNTYPKVNGHSPAAKSGYRGTSPGGTSRSTSSSSVGSVNGCLIGGVKGSRKQSLGSSCSSGSSASSHDGDSEHSSQRDLVNAQYNSPVNLYSEDSIAETLSAQAEVLGKGVLGINFKKYEREEKIRTDSPTYKLLHGEEEPVRKPRPPSLLNDSVSHPQFQSGLINQEQQKGYYNINEKLYCDIHAKQAARTNPPGPNVEPITVQPGAIPPVGAMTAPQASRMKIPTAFQQGSAPAPAPAPAPATVRAPPAPVQIPAPVPAPQPEVLEPVSQEVPEPAPEPVPERAPVPAPHHQPFVPAPAPAPVVAAPMKPASAPAPNFSTSANPQGFGAPAGDINVRSHIPKKGDVPAPAPMTFAPAPAPMTFAPAPAPISFAPARAPMPAPAPAPIPGFGLSSGPMPKPMPPPGMGGKIGPGGPPARGVPQAPGHKSAPRRGRGVMIQPASASRIPVCNACQRQIRGPFISALGKTWCPDHFICATPTCKCNIIDMGFVEEQGMLYCENCYESYLAPICGKCDKRIKGDCLNAVGKQFHPECFCCAYCGKVFGSGAFYLEDGLPYCETDWNDLFTTKCVGCNFPIEAGDRWVEALNNNYHSQCFKCSKCQKNLEGQSFFAKGGKPFCKAHAQRGF